MTDANYALTPSSTGSLHGHVDLDFASQLSGLHPDMILEFVRARLVTARVDAAGNPHFDNRAIYRLRQIEHLRQEQRTGMRMIRLIIQLLDRAERAERELRHLRDRML